MSLNKKHICFIMFCVSILFAVVHFVWCACVNQVDIQSVLLNVIPYGLPIICFGLAWRGFDKGNINLTKADEIFALLFALCYITMVLHVTIEGSIDNFINVYFNIPIWYAIPYVLLLILRSAVRTKPTKTTKPIGFVLYFLPILVIVAMLVHCTIEGIFAYIRQSLTTSFPWYDNVLIVAIPYAFAIPLLLIPYIVYYNIKKKKTVSSDD